MKCIVLAKMGKRILAAAVDFLITIAISLLLFFTCVLPLSFDNNVYYQNEKTMYEVMNASGLYIKERIDDKDVYSLTLDVATSKLTSNMDEKSIQYLNEFEYKEQKYYIIDQLFRFYNEPPKYNGELVFNEHPSSFETISKDIFKVGSEASNIKEIKLDSIDNKYKISLIDPEKRAVTFDFVANAIKNTNDHDTFTSAVEIITSAKPYKEANDMNKHSMLVAILLIIPTVFVVSLIFYLIIPICSKNGETIGKYITKICVLTQDGYELKKPYYIARFFSFFIFEFALGVLSFGGIFLISYLMFCFSKKRRCLHDYMANSVVVDKQESTWFKNREQEYEYNYKTRL